MDSILDRLARMVPPEVRARVEEDYPKYLSSCHNSALQMLPPISSNREGTVLAQGAEAPSDSSLQPDMSQDEIMDAMIKAPSDSPFPLLGRHPCANVNVAKYSACSKPGTMACSECRLVSYCSKVKFSIHTSETNLLNPST